MLFDGCRNVHLPHKISEIEIDAHYRVCNKVSRNKDFVQMNATKLSEARL